jgi:hypothetical protein
MLETLFTKFDLYLENEFTLGELIVFMIGSLFFVTVGVDSLQIGKIILGVSILAPSLLMTIGSLKALIYRYLVK